MYLWKVTCATSRNYEPPQYYLPAVIGQAGLSGKPRYCEYYITRNDKESEITEAIKESNRPMATVKRIVLVGRVRNDHQFVTRKWSDELLANERRENNCASQAFYAVREQKLELEDKVRELEKELKKLQPKEKKAKQVTADVQ